MSEIIETESVVLSKLAYGDSSIIADLFTEDYGRISVIVKGGRSPKSKIGLLVDPLNHLQVVFYKKDTRDIQLLSSAEILSHFPSLKDHLQKLKYAYGVIELIKNLMAEHEVNKRLFKGVVRILSRINSSNEKPDVSFGRFFLFLLKEIGYEFQAERCAVCNGSDFSSLSLYYNFDKGLICGKCTKETVDFYEIYLELFQYLSCLKTNIPADNYSDKTIDDANSLLERHLKYHVPDFKGIQSLQIVK
ncbi:MAG: DNA repair protein RecO [Ignavibacteriaceae bacterium]|nr:DNA repair protein RecO [Ignavibacteriaceae bacterium]